ncbi:MAG: putative Phage integrase (modular protein) [Nitrospira sp.]|nr:putative Phage integrase (modular protein) [Nitrospira sp.]
MSYLIKKRPSKRHGTAFDLYYRFRGEKYRPTLGYNLSPEDAERLAINMVAKIQRESEAPTHAVTWLTFSDAVQTYWKTMQNTQRIDLMRPRIAIEKHLMPRFGRRTLASLIAEDGIEYVSARCKEKAAPATIRREWNVFMRILNLAVDHDKLDKNRLKRVALPEAVSRERIANDAELIAVQKVAPEELWSIVLVALHTGLREGKIVGMQGSWLTRRDDGWWLSIPASRSRLKGTPRELPLNRIAAHVLGERCVNDKVFTRWTRASLAVYWGRLCKRARVHDLHFHDLRHTFATRLQNAGVGLEVRSALLGHTVRGIGGDFGSTAMTSRYSHGGRGWNAQLREAVTILETAYTHALLSYDLSYERREQSAAESQPTAKPLQDQGKVWCPQRDLNPCYCLERAMS